MLAHALGAAPAEASAGAGRLAAAVLAPVPAAAPPEPANDVAAPPRRPRKPRQAPPRPVIPLRLLPTPPAVTPPPPRFEHSADPNLEASRCRAILLEVIQRAAHDWVLYRTSDRLPSQDVALDAYTWLFEEKPGHPWWEDRKQHGTTLMSFLSICEVLDLDPKKVRERIRRLTPKEILTSGRPAERRTKTPDEHSITEHGVETVSLSSLEQSDEQFSSMYEAHYAVYTSD